jgi:hypothetical protein
MEERRETLTMRTVMMMMSEFGYQRPVVFIVYMTNSSIGNAIVVYALIIAEHLEPGSCG